MNASNSEIQSKGTTVICSYFSTSSAYFFNGKEKDYESGFHYYGSRYYSSEISMWLSTDPMADKYPSLSPYNYCANNPIKLIDPNGEELYADWFISRSADCHYGITRIVKWADRHDDHSDALGNWENLGNYSISLETSTYLNYTNDSPYPELSSERIYDSYDSYVFKQDRYNPNLWENFLNNLRELDYNLEHGKTAYNVVKTIMSINPLCSIAFGIDEIEQGNIQDGVIDISTGSITGVKYFKGVVPTVKTVTKDFMESKIFHAIFGNNENDHNRVKDNKSK